MAAMTGMLALFIYHLAAPDYRLVILKIQHWRALAMIVVVLIADERTRLIREQILLRNKNHKKRMLNSQQEAQNQPDEAAVQKY